MAVMLIGDVQELRRPVIFSTNVTPTITTKASSQQIPQIGVVLGNAGNILSFVVTRTAGLEGRMGRQPPNCFDQRRL